MKLCQDGSWSGCHYGQVADAMWHSPKTTFKEARWMAWNWTFANSQMKNMLYKYILDKILDSIHSSFCYAWHLKTWTSWITNNSPDDLEIFGTYPLVIYHCYKLDLPMKNWIKMVFSMANHRVFRISMRHLPHRSFPPKSSPRAIARDQRRRVKLPRTFLCPHAVMQRIVTLW